MISRQRRPLGLEFKQKAVRLVFVVVMLVVLVIVGWSWLGLNSSYSARSLSLPAMLPHNSIERGRLFFAYGDLGVIDLDTLETNALPWALLTAALALDAAKGDPQRVTPAMVEDQFRSVGFLYPAQGRGISMLPFGVNLGRVQRVMPPISIATVNIGCAACHAGVSYDSRGYPDPALPVAGTPNTSLDLEAYAQLVYRSLKGAFSDETALWQAMERLHPDMSWRERLSLRLVVFPQARVRMEELEANGDQPLPFPNGRPGLTNGVAALKQRLGLDTSHDTVAGFVSIPDLADRTFRSSFLADGAYAVPGTERFSPRTRKEAAEADPVLLGRIASFFTVPSMGMSPKRAEEEIPAVVDIVRFLATYRAPAFPGEIEREKLPLGREVYARDCARCHGRYDDSLESPRLQHFPNWAGDIGTEATRAEVFDAELATAVSETHYAAYIEPAATGKLVALPLSGVWASAPYFVNGSVPTLRHVLEPETRPERFMVGGHRLDMEKVGLALAPVPGKGGVWRYPAGYEPFSTPAEVDTRQPGFSNRGHDAEVEGLTTNERDALLEYLKLL